MKRILYVDLEDLPQRYTSMMNKAIRPYVDIIISGPTFETNQIEVGQFLDVNRTINYKAHQLQIISKLFEKGKIKNGDVFLIGDLFFPGIESIRYMAELQGIKIEMYGFNYAGRADSTDFVQQLGVWSDYSELGYHLCMDGVFVGSRFHKNNILRWMLKLSTNYPKIYDTGYVYDRDYIRGIYNKKDQKEDYVIWPHRLSKEKGVDDLERFIKTTQKRIIITSSGKPNEEGLRLSQNYWNVDYLHSLSKAEYYEKLSKAKYYLSTAYQETFGYTLQEAIHFGCRIAVPDRACYNEMAPLHCLYNDISEIEKCWDQEVSQDYTEVWNGNIKMIIDIIESK